MKKITKLPEPTAEELAGPKYWRSLDEVAETPGFRNFLDREFPEGASILETVDRRHFLKIMAASFAFAGMGMTGCRRPEKVILPYNQQPEHVVHGKPAFFASSMPLRGYGVPVLAETHANRPTKIEGNPSFAPNNGKTDLPTQASILNLYDPDRATRSLLDGRQASRSAIRDLLDELSRKYRDAQGRGLAILADQSRSPTRQRLRKVLAERFPEAVWCEYEPLDYTRPEKVLSRLLGQPAKPLYDFSKAARVLSLDADFLGNDPNRIAHSRAFAQARRVTAPGDEMNRLYSIESAMTLTGGMADHRKRLASSATEAYAFAVAAGVLRRTNGDSRLQARLEAAIADSTLDQEWIDGCVEDLVENGSRSVILAGDHLSEAVQAAVFAANSALGAVGETVSFVATEENAAESVHELMGKVEDGEVETLFVLNGNPAYNLPVDYSWKEIEEKVGEVIRYGYYYDETSEGARAHIAGIHYLESWGDTRAPDGTILPVQPMILPLFQGYNELEVLARLIGMDKTDPYDLVFETITELRSGQDKNKVFRVFLHDGVLEDSSYAAIERSLPTGAVSDLIPTKAAGTDGFSRRNLEVRYLADNSVDDGRFNNNGWLQECPDPITRLTWENAILISPTLARELDLEAPDPTLAIVRKNPNEIKTGIQRSPILELRVGDKTVRGPVHIQPGLATYTVVVHHGFGRTKTGRIGEGSGFNCNEIRFSDSPAFTRGASLHFTGETRNMANVQNHWSMEGRAIIRESNKDYFEKKSDTFHTVGMESHTPLVLRHDHDMPLHERATQTPRGTSMHPHPELTGRHQWGMAVDLSTCTGCNACVVACQSENNIPIVGRDQVIRGREMSWIRIDRYYASGVEDNNEVADDVQVSMQPVMCQHCENAPCETVCPVNATVHDEEGLNVMAYNRCIGTRYCANNCPYKVRRFNFFDWNERQLDQLYLGPLGEKGMNELHKMQKNPEVSVRMRGVMEKCTYCTQRIESAKINQKVLARDSDNVKIPDGTFQVACQQACPTESIMFGDISDPESEVSKWKNREQDYLLLGYLNVRPRTSYLGRLRNPNPAMPDYDSQPLSRKEYYMKNYPESYTSRAEN
ncbi:MAG: TAT-variant-translocated molybdopterin oxidoreductase [Opitutales bacterium]|nr:TAT-variant-translocated molybdopterin oxidoreductase [Opitutales bacterium]